MSWLKRLPTFNSLDIGHPRSTALSAPLPASAPWRRFGGSRDEQKEHILYISFTVYVFILYIDLQEEDPWTFFAIHFSLGRCPTSNCFWGMINQSEYVRHHGLPCLSWQLGQHTWLFNLTRFQLRTIVRRLACHLLAKELPSNLSWRRRRVASTFEHTPTGSAPEVGTNNEHQHTCPTVCQIALISSNPFLDILVAKDKNSRASQQPKLGRTW